MSSSTPSTNTGYWQLLAENSDFRKLFTGQLVSLLGDWFNYIAVQILVYDLTQSALAAGLAIIASNLPAFFLTPIAGAIVDRFDRRKIMIIADVSRGLLALGLLLVRSADQLWLVYILTAALVAFGSFFNPALSAAVPNLVKREQLLTANALTNALWGFMLAAGAMVGGLTIALVGRDLAFVVNSLSFFFSAVMLWSIRKPFAQSHHGANRSLNPFADFREGLSYAWKRPQVMALLTVKTGGGLAGGVILLLTVFGVKVFNSGAFGIGLLQAARGTGILLGPLIVRAVASSEIGRIQKLIAAGFFVTGIAYALFSFSPALGGNLVLWQTTSTSGSNAQVFNLSLALVIALIAVFVAHNGWGSNWTSSSTLLQQLTPDRIRGRIFSMDFGMVTLAIAFSTFLTGAAVEKFDPQTIALALGAVFVLYGAVWSIAVWWSQRTQPDEWRVGSLHHVAANLEEAPVTTGE